MEFIIALATDNGKTFIDKHAGDARYFDLYTVSDREILFLKRIQNPPKEEKKHADPEKAGGITRLLKNEGVQVMVSKVFGPNIKRMKKQFVCVMLNDARVADSLHLLKQNLSKVAVEWQNGETRNVINLKR